MLEVAERRRRRSAGGRPRQSDRDGGDGVGGGGLEDTDAAVEPAAVEERHLGSLVAAEQRRDGASQRASQNCAELRRIAQNCAESPHAPEQRLRRELLSLVVVEEPRGAAELACAERAIERARCLVVRGGRAGGEGRWARVRRRSSPWRVPHISSWPSLCSAATKPDAASAATEWTGAVDGSVGGGRTAGVKRKDARSDFARGSCSISRGDESTHCGGRASPSENCAGLRRIAPNCARIAPELRAAPCRRPA